ncbi:unknown [Bacteroides eggerthii CAG:109]|nr:unknown [Bacteroides eggerthii CAG:109]
MTGNVEPIVVYKIFVSGCKTMCFVETVAYDDNSIHVTVYEIL